MAVISVRAFGGIMPGVAGRALPLDAATQAEGLVARVSEFRPVLDSTSYASVLSMTNPKTIWRFRYTAAGALNSSFSSGWKAYSASRSEAVGDNLPHEPVEHERNAVGRFTCESSLSSAFGQPAPLVSYSFLRLLA